jgi:N-acetylglucosaminyldiphosphoundecaprenol N-acetyl-beta-D-mannosaminyltransferase
MSNPDQFDLVKLYSLDSLRIKKLRKEELVHFQIDLGKYQDYVDWIVTKVLEKKSGYVCIANAHMFVEAYKDEVFNRIIREADLVTPDGQSLVWALKLLKGINQDRVAGMDLLPDLLQRLSYEKIAIYFYGGTKGTLEKTNTFLKNKFPDLKIAGLHSPPFRDLTSLEEKEIIDEINKTSPSLVFIVLGCPKQEKWMASMKGKINTLMIGIGGALPVMIGMQKRAPLWMRNNGLEWLFRLLLEPKRLFKRYLTTNSLFLWILFKSFLRNRVSHSPDLKEKSSR